MALTITSVNTGILGDIKYRTVDVAFDASYPTGGESLTADMLGFDRIYYVRAHASIGYALKYNYTNHTLIAYRIGIAASSIVSGADNTIVKDAAGTGIEVSGTGTAFQAALSEVSDTSDMSTDLASVRVFIIGI